MAFSSLPTYLDASNWNQGVESSSGSLLLAPKVHGGDAAARPRSMAERARMANLPMPESALRCPRCESTNTKFCYFNNYSLSQPRHFCKSCRRYWTIGGALRNVPVGGGCRRNKRSSKTSKSKPATSSNATSTVLGHHGLAPQLPATSSLPPLPQLPENYFDRGAVEPLFSSGLKSWRFNQTRQIPFLCGSDSSSSPEGIFQFHGSEAPVFGGGLLPNLSGPLFNHLEPVKMEDTSLPKQLMDEKLMRNDHWSNAASSWNEFQILSSSSAGNPMYGMHED